MKLVSPSIRRTAFQRAVRKGSLISIVLMGMCTLGSVQAAQLTCGPASTPLRISTAKATWSTDARYVSAPTGAAATIVDNYKWRGWFNKTTAVHPSSAGALAGQPVQGDWLSFGDAQYPTSAGGNTGTGPYPAVITDGVVANGALVARRVSFTYNEKITIPSNVDLSTIKLIGSGGFDDSTLLLVKPDNIPSGANTNNWINTSASFANFGSPSLINVNGANTGMGFYYGDNTIGFAVVNTGYAPTTSADNPTGLFADFQITADCLPELPPAPTPATTALSCPVGKLPGDEFEIGPFTTNARDWSWTWRTRELAPREIEEVTQPLFDDYKYRSYFNPRTLPAPQAPTVARWISPGTTSPGAGDLPGVPYPKATGQAKAFWYGSVFTMNHPITVSDNVDLDSIKLKGRFGFDDTGDSVFVQPAGKPAYRPFAPNLLQDGYGGFTSQTTPAIPGFEVGSNTIGLVLDGGQFENDCSTGVCALAAIADFTVVAKCQEPPPVDPEQQTINFRQPNPGVYSAMNGSTVAWGPTPPLFSTANLPVTYTSTTPSVCTVNASTGVVTLVSPAVAGNCTIEANAAAGTRTIDGIEYNVAAAPPVQRTMQITLLKDQLITFLDQEGRDVADGAFAIDPAAVSSSGLPVTYTSLTPTICAVSGGTVTPYRAGTCTIAADQPGNQEYAAATRVSRSIALTGSVPAIVAPVPTLEVAGLGLLGLLSAGMGALALRRRKRAE
ncbi:hypothetical protein [Ottowia thiooxydans]|uniref:IPTL-CTERM protein sorting domain-containing protein n=1 Tax=Ottowia thiooxydans TaxID=219182 RepID=A0ABV2QHU5_9BURK